MENLQLDSEVVAFIERYLEVSGLSSADSLPQQRIDYETMVRYFQYPHPDGISTYDQRVIGRHGDIPLRNYRLGTGNDECLVMFLHGGGFIFGSLDSHDDICAELCAATGFDLVSVDYRLAPEYLHPAHLDDVEDAFRILGHRNCVLVGASAGATLASALCHRLKSAQQRPAGQVLIYPGLGGDAFNLDSYRVNAQAPLLSTADVHFYRAQRCADIGLALSDPEFYPLLAEDFSATPATIAFSADVDPLRDDAGLYVEKLLAAGVDAEWINEPGLVHDYLRARHVSSIAGAAFARICDAIGTLAG
jgi:acetyl esterase